MIFKFFEANGYWFSPLFPFIVGSGLRSSCFPEASEVAIAGFPAILRARSRDSDGRRHPRGEGYSDQHRNRPDQGSHQQRGRQLPHLSFAA